MAGNDTDKNKMRAQNWKPAKFTGFQSYKVEQKNDNVELFNAIKGLIQQAVTLLRGKADDDKYRYIVDMIMMRIRAAMADKISENDDQLIESISDGVQKILEPYSSILQNNKNSSPSATETHAVSDTSEPLAAIADSILQKIEELKTDVTENFNELSSVADNLSSAVDSDENILDESQTPTETPSVTAESEQPAQVPTQTSTRGDETAKSAEQLTKLIGLVDSQQQVLFQVDQNVMQMNDILTRTICPEIDKQREVREKVEEQIQTIEKVSPAEKLMLEIQEKLEKKQSSDIKKISETDQKLAQQQITRVQAKKERKQLKLINKRFDNTLGSATKKLNRLSDVQKNNFDKMTKTLDVIDENTKKPFDFRMFIISMLIVGGVLAVIFWKKIKKWLDEVPWMKKILIGVAKAIKWVVKMAWNGLTKFSGEVWDIIKNGLVSLKDWVVEKFKTAWEALVTWTKDVWDWITGRSKETKEAQDENELKAELTAEQILNGNAKVLDLELSKCVDNMTKTVDQHNKELDRGMTDTVKKSEQFEKTIGASMSSDMSKISKDVNTTVQDVNVNVHEIRKTTDDMADQAVNVTIPQMSADLQKQTNDSIAGMSDKLDNKILEAERRAEIAVNEMEARAKAEGAATNVNTEILRKLENEAGDGAQITGGINDRTSPPSNVGVVKLDDRGSQKPMYADKSEIDSVGAVDSMSDFDDQGLFDSEDEIAGRLTVESSQPDIKVVAYQEYVDVIKSTSEMTNDIRKNGTILTKLQVAVEDYFKEITFLAEICTNSLSQLRIPNIQGSASGGPSLLMVTPGESGSGVSGDNK